jgi:uncharacterized membrane protein
MGPRRKEIPMPYQTLVLAHGAAGLVALAAFWVTAALRKGTRLHRRVGGTYLVAMAVVMATTPFLAGVQFARGNAAAGTFLSYLVVITATAMWVAWRAVRDRARPEAFYGRAFRAIAWTNVASGAVALAIGLDGGGPVLVGMSLIGLVTGTRMLRAAGRPVVDRNWWLKRHYGGILGCGIATHIAFLNIGLQRLLPADLGAFAQYVGWFGPVVGALVAWLWLERRYGRGLAASAAAPRPASG